MVKMKISKTDSSQKKFSVIHRLKSFAYAWSGIKSVLKNEHNTWIHLFLTITAMALGIVLKLADIEWAILIIVTAMVWMAELFNTCIEKIMDFSSTDYHPQIKLIKDMAAAAVLIASIAALIAGAIIFIPKIMHHVPFSIQK
jgi:diacylglycerol kinase